MGELHKPEEVGGVVLQTYEEPSCPLLPGKEPLDEPPPFVSPKVATIFGFEFPGRAMP